MILSDAADDAASAVDGRFSMVSHHEIAVFGHLIRKFDVAFSQCLLAYVGLVMCIAVEIDSSVRLDPDIVSRTGNDSLYQYFV